MISNWAKSEQAKTIQTEVKLGMREAENPCEHMGTRAEILMRAGERERDISMY